MFKVYSIILTQEILRQGDFQLLSVLLKVKELWTRSNLQHQKLNFLNLKFNSSKQLLHFNHCQLDLKVITLYNPSN